MKKVTRMYHMPKNVSQSFALYNSINTLVYMNKSKKSFFSFLITGNINDFHFEQSRKAQEQTEDSTGMDRCSKGASNHCEDMEMGRR